MSPLYILSLGLLLLHTTPLCSSIAVSNDTLTAGQVLVVGGKLVSRNGKFALNFFQFQPTNTISKSTHNARSPSSWYLGVWFNNVPVFTTVWVANRDQAITDHNLNLTQLKISSDGNLVIVNQAANTESVISSSHIVNNRTQTSSINTSTIIVVLLNSGNLVLRNSLSSDLVLWQSFDYPTDVVLPGAKFGRNKVTGFSRRLISKKSLIDPGLGSYIIELEDTKGIVLQYGNLSVVYWHWPSPSTSSLNLIPILKTYLDSDSRTKGLINPTYVDNNQEEYYMYTSPNESSSTYFSLDISGQININVWSQANQSWQIVYSEHVDSCTPFATCGPFTVCNGIAKPFCDCMENFSQKSPLDWNFSDRTGGCIRNTPLHCSTSDKNITSSTDMFHPIARVTLPYNPKSIDIATTQSECEEACLGSCSCTTYSYNNSRCSVWTEQLLSVNLNDGIDNTSEDILYLRLAAKDLLPSLRKK
uniref:Uncharacterized protein n=1 Tax=Avena sativa TaxID=4498 RepID=A0ACD5W892_AVESA